MTPKARFKGRVLVGGAAEGEAVVVDSISFYGDVDPETGAIISSGRSVSGRILVARRSRGSTVGSYVIYALARNSVAPKAIIIGEAEPIIVAGCVLASIPLVDRLPDEFFETVTDGSIIRVSLDGTVEVYEPGVKLE